MKSGAVTSAAILLALLTWVPARADAPASQPGRKAVIVQLSGEINDFTRDQLIQHLAQADGMGAQVVILDIDTYGGEVPAALEISRAIKREKIKVIAFVKDKAISAGAMAAMACDEIVMGRSASLGDCAPIIFSGGELQALPPAERDKQESPVRTDFEESAQRNSHDRLLALAMVHVGSAVYWMQDSHGRRKFVDKAEYDRLLAGGDWICVPDASCPIVSDTQLLTVDSDHAVLYGLATGKADSAEDLAAQRHFTVIGTLNSGFGETLVYWLSSWPARLLIIIIFLQCFYVVLHLPGHGVAEVIGLIALGLMLGVPLLTGYAQWPEILAIFLGLALIALEILLPGHLFPGIIGAFLVLFGLVMTFVPAEPGGPTLVPTLPAGWAGLQKGVLVVAAALGISLALWYWLSRYLPKMPYFNRLILPAVVAGGKPAAAAGSAATTTTIIWPPIGAVGSAVSDLRPGGAAEFFDDSISDQRVTSVVSESGYVLAGEKVQVRQVAGGRVVVRKV